MLICKFLSANVQKNAFVSLLNHSFYALKGRSKKACLAGGKIARI